MATSKSIIDAANDNDLVQRAIALASEMSIPGADGVLPASAWRLASAPVDESGNTVASVYEYAAARYEEAVRALPPKPGVDPAAVTDEHLRHALRSLTETGE